jgi:hypothetical protein
MAQAVGPLSYIECSYIVINLCRNEILYTYMNSTTRNILIVVAVLAALVLLARYVVFKEQFEEAGAGLERVGAWQDSYRAEHPDATDEEVDAAFRAGIANIEVWQARYKQEHPEATKAEMDAAFSAQFSGQ